MTIYTYYPTCNAFIEEITLFRLFESKKSLKYLHSTFFNVFLEINSFMAFQFIIFAKDDNAKKCIEDKQDICGYGVQKIRAVDSLSV